MVQQGFTVCIYTYYANKYWWQQPFKNIKSALLVYYLKSLDCWPIYVTSTLVAGITSTHLLVFILAVKSTLLFTLLTSDGRSVLPLRVGAALTLATDEGCDYVTILARCRLSIRLHADFTLFTNRTCTEFAITTIFV